MGEPQNWHALCYGQGGNVNIQGPVPRGSRGPGQQGSPRGQLWTVVSKEEPRAWRTDHTAGQGRGYSSLGESHDRGSKLSGSEA